MNSRRAAFYAERDRRTRQYGGTDEALERPVLIAVGPDVAGTRAGQIATLALVNMAARVHRRVGLDLSPAPLIARTLVPAIDFQDAAIQTALAINPVLDLYLGPLIQDHSFAASIGLGINVPLDLGMYLDWSGGLGVLATSPMPSPWLDPGSLFGAATAAVLGSAGLFRQVHGQPIRATLFNPVTLTFGKSEDTDDRVGPIDVGDVLVIGAGAVATALLYWAREIGIHGQWDVVDGDWSELSNTNRCLTMTAAHAGWPDGEPRGTSLAKAVAAAQAIEVGHHTQWYDQWQPDHDVRYDLVLPLANDRGVRALMAQRGEPLLLHATTSANWTAELHRHSPDRDDCPACRIPDTAQPKMACANGPAIPEQPSSPDAALPFLSAGAGLLLAAALADLNQAPALETRFNHWQLDMTLSGYPLRSLQHPRRRACTHTQPPNIRRVYQSTDPRRWDYLDHETA